MTKDTVDINVPHSAIMAPERTQSFSIQRVPNIGLRVFSTGKYQISFPIILDLSDGPLVSM